MITSKPDPNRDNYIEYAHDVLGRTWASIAKDLRVTSVRVSTRYAMIKYNKAKEKTAQGEPS